MGYDNCPICERSIPYFSWSSKGYADINCEVCGNYRLTELAARDVYSSPPIKDRHILSAAIREHYEQGITLRVDNLEHLRDSVVAPQNPIESIDKILMHILSKTESAETGVPISKETDFPIGYARTAAEFAYWIEIAAGNMQYIEAYPNGKHFRLMMNGWQRLARLPKKHLRADQAFVAMWFDPALEEIWEDGIKAALLHTGYKPIRIDRTQHNNKIDDQIVAQIRKSALLVADVTGQRNGVYFEAGFAIGLGIPVIWSCREDDILKIHFDTRQYNHIKWQGAQDLRESLINRIEGTLLSRAIHRPA